MKKHITFALDSDIADLILGAESDREEHLLELLIGSRQHVTVTRIGQGSWRLTFGRSIGDQAEAGTPSRGASQ